jgi:POT family proton-dependent oligopeptide transporter
MSDSTEGKKSPLQEITQPFIDLINAPRALWGINVGYVLEGAAYFGVLSYLALHFSDFIFIGVENPNDWAHKMVGVLTAGITIAMFFLGFIADKKGIRFALVGAFFLLLGGRALMSAAPTLLGMEPAGLWSPLHLTTLAGMLLIVIGYGMYQPAAYAGVRLFTTPKTAAMGFAMLYALMNLGGWLPTFAFVLRDDDFAGIGIVGVFWVYTGMTVVGLLATYFILSKRTVEKETKRAAEETARIKAAAGETAEETAAKDAAAANAPQWEGHTDIAPHLWLLLVATIVFVYLFVAEPANYVICVVLAVAPVMVMIFPGAIRFIARHPLSNSRFAFFIFCLIPVQTLFTYNWLVLPQYIKRAFDGWIGEYFEIAANANPLLIFVLAPVIAALTMKKDTYRMMIIGTTVMAAPAFLLVIGPYWWTLALYILVMTVGEAMWQPRFLQWAAEIAPKGRTGEYMGVAQLPWFLTKVLVPLLYSGWMMDKYCPDDGPKDTETMWLIYAIIAITTPIMLIIAKRWMGKQLEEKAA